MDLRFEAVFPLIAAVLAEGRRACFTVSGTSMRPFLHTGDVVELAPLAGAPLQVGDLILARRTNGVFVLHRVARVANDRFYLLGDAQQIPEGPLFLSQIIGRVEKTWREGRVLPLRCLDWRLTTHTWLRLRRFRPLLRALGRRVRRRSG